MTEEEKLKARIAELEISRKKIKKEILRFENIIVKHENQNSTILPTNPNKKKTNI